MVEEDRRAEAARHGGLARTNWRAIWALYAGGLVCGALIGKVPPALPVLRDEFGLTLVEGGLVATTISLLGALVGVTMGLLGDRYGRKRLALAGLATIAAGGLLGAAAEDYAMLLGARFLEGVGFMLYSVMGAALIAAASATLRDCNRAMGLWTTYLPAGIAGAMLAAPPALASIGWWGSWAALAALALACAALVRRTVPASQPAGAGTLQLALQSLARRGAWVLASLFLFYVAQWASVMVWLPTVIVEERGGSAAAAGILGALMVLANVPGNLAGGWLLARGLRRGTLVIAVSALGAASMAGMLANELPDSLRYALVIVFSCVMGVIPVSVFSGVPLHARSPAHVATTNGLVLQAAQIGQVAAPILFAWIASRYGGWTGAAGAMFAFAAACALCGLALLRLESKLE